jgi:hypothetical protein
MTAIARIAASWVLTPVYVSPVWQFIWGAASVSRTDADAISGGFAYAGFDGTGSASDLFGVIRIVNILSDKAGRRYSAHRVGAPWFYDCYD